MSLSPICCTRMAAPPTQSQAHGEPGLPPSPPRPLLVPCTYARDPPACLLRSPCSADVCTVHVTPPTPFVNVDAWNDCLSVSNASDRRSHSFTGTRPRRSAVGSSLLFRKALLAERACPPPPSPVRDSRSVGRRQQERKNNQMPRGHWNRREQRGGGCPPHRHCAVPVFVFPPCHEQLPLASDHGRRGAMPSRPSFRPHPRSPTGVGPAVRRQDGRASRPRGLPPPPPALTSTTRWWRHGRQTQLVLRAGRSGAW